MRYVSRALQAGGLGLVALLVAACGSGSGLLSSSQGSQLTTELSQASADVTNGDCTGADTLIENVQTQVANLPGSVNSTLVSDLDQAAKTVLTLANRDCSGTVAAGTDNTPGPANAGTTTHTSSTATKPQTTPTTPSTTSSTPATTTPTSGTTTTGGGGGAGLPGSGDSGEGSGQSGNGGGQGGGAANGQGGGQSN
jgi:hypothetical protein